MAATSSRPTSPWNKRIRNDGATAEAAEMGIVENRTKRRSP
jgi:hypothetical protein